MKKQGLHIKLGIIPYIISAIILTSLGGCGGTDFLSDHKRGAPGPGDDPTNLASFNGSPSGNDAISASTNQSGKEEEKAPQLNPYEGAGYVKPPQVNNYGTVNLAYEMDLPPGRAGVQPGIGLSYSSSGGDGLCGIGWSLSTGLGVISRTTTYGELYYDHRDTFTFNGGRLLKVEGPADSENGVYRLEIESGFSRFVLSEAESGGVWRVYDKAGRVTTFGEDRGSRIYRPDNEYKTYIWNFSRTFDLNGNYMYAVYDDSDYDEDHILYLKEIRYTGSLRENDPARQYVRFRYKTRDEAYVSKAPGFVMTMDRILDEIEVGWEDPDGWIETELWTYEMVYGTSEDSNRPLLKTVESTKESTKPEFIYQPAIHSLVWAKIRNPRAGDPEVNPDATQYFEGDFNGDGISDMVFFNPETGYWRAMEGNRDGGYFDRVYGMKFKGYDTEDEIQWFKGNVSGDYNGDGRSDIAFYLPRTKEFWVAEHDGEIFNFKKYGTLYIDLDIFKCEWFTGDYDGNGLSDAVLFHEPTGEWYLMTNEGGRFAFVKFSECFKNLFRSDYRPNMNMDSEATADTSVMGKDRAKVLFLSGDYNGDGRTDISIYDMRSGRWWVAENYRDDTSASLGAGSIGFRLQWLLYKEFTSREMELFAPREQSLAGNDRFSGDFNGDGYSDFLIFQKDTGEWIIGETGASTTLGAGGTINFRVYSRTPQFKEITRWLQGDFNGDGRTDIGFFSKSDYNFWIGEATPQGFRFRVYNNLSYGPDPDRVLATPLPKDEVKISSGNAVIENGSATSQADFQFDGSAYADRGEMAFPGFFTGTAAELVIFNRAEDRLFLKGQGGDPAVVLSGIDLAGDGVTILNNQKADRYRGKDGILYYEKETTLTGGTNHIFNLIQSGTGGFEEVSFALFSSSLMDFNISESFYLCGAFAESDEGKYLLALDDKAETPSFKLFIDPGTPETLAVTGALTAAKFKDLRLKKVLYKLFAGDFTGSGRVQVLMVDMSGTSHRWYLGSLSSGTISFTELYGTPKFVAEGYTGTYRVVPQGLEASLIYANTVDGQVCFHLMQVSGSGISQITYSPLSKDYTFKDEYDHQDNPVLRSEAGLKKAVLGTSLRVESLTAIAAKLDRPDLLEKVYPFRWIQGDYNGDGKTDIGIFHLKEPTWYFALTQGTVPDMIESVKNGIGGTYRFEYENSTRFDNTGEDGIPHLPMNYKVCSRLEIEDGLGGSVATRYEYSGGYAFSAFIDGYKETDYFGFGRFVVIDNAGIKSVSEYNNVPYDDFRMNRALAGAVKETRTVGSDNKEYQRTEHEYRLHAITTPTAPLNFRGERPTSFIIEPVKVTKYVKGTLTETRASNIVLTPEKYEMVSKTESVTDHYQDSVHAPATVSTYTEFENIEATNEMRLLLTKGLIGTAHETTTGYEYDQYGNLTRQTVAYTGTGLAAVPNMVMEFEYDGYGNQTRQIDASGTPNRVTEKVYDAKLHQFVVEERAYGDAVTLSTSFSINYGRAFGGISTKTDPNGASTYFDYDSQGRLASQRIDTEGGVATLNSYEYDTDFPLSAKVTMYDGNGEESETRAFCDGMGRVIHTVSSATDEPGRRYVKSGMLVYDAAGRVIRKSQTGWAGDDEIDRFVANTKEKNPTLTEYDPIGRVKKVTLPEGYTGEGETSTTYTYNEPYETTVTHSVGRSKRTITNGRGQVLYIEESGTGDNPSAPLGAGSGTGEFISAAIGFAYDLAGHRVKKMDLTPSASLGASSPPTGMSLDIPQNLFYPGVKDASGKNIAVWRYDGFGRPVDSSDPDLGYRGVTYTVFGETGSVTDSLNKTTDFVYDRLGRLTQKILPGTEGTVTYQYDQRTGSDNALGRVTAIDDTAQLKVFSYDRIGRVKRETREIKNADGIVYETLFSHDLLDRQKSITYPADPQTGTRVTATYQYAAMGVNGLSVTNGTESQEIITGIDYNEYGQMERITRGNGTVTAYTYDIKGRLSRLLTTANHNGSTWKLQDVTYQFKVDNSIKRVENNPDVDTQGAATSTIRYEYSYDGLNRLVDATGYYEKEPSVGDSVLKQYRRGYAYSQNGNLTGKTIYDPVTGTAEDQWSYTYQNHAVTSIYTTANGNRFEMGYDANGNMIYQRDNKESAAKAMAYDSHNRIREVTDPDTGNMMGQYWYDDQGFRVRKKAIRTIDGFDREVELQYPSMYYAREVQRELGGAIIPGTEQGVNNLYLQGVRIAAVTRNCGAVYYLTDQVDSVKVVVDEDGQALAMTEYLPYGETWFQEGDTKHAPKYNSQELDQETGYYFYNARHYDGEIARFVTPDTVVDGETTIAGWNRYMYVHGNPIVYRDPTGHNIFSDLLDKASDFLSGSKSQGNGGNYGGGGASSSWDGNNKIKKTVENNIKNEKSTFDRYLNSIKSKALEKFIEFDNWATSSVPTSRDKKKGYSRYQTRKYNSKGNEEPITGFNIKEVNTKSEYLKHILLGEKGPVMRFFDKAIHQVAVDHDNWVVEKGLDVDDSEFWWSMPICAVRGYAAATYNQIKDDIISGKSITPERNKPEKAKINGPKINPSVKKEINDLLWEKPDQKSNNYIKQFGDGWYNYN